MSDKKIIPNPTWDDIYKMIHDFDVSKKYPDGKSITIMKGQGLDLGDYAQVSAMAHKIYYYLAYKLMPKGNPWPPEYIKTYNNWLKNGCPRDEAHQAEIKANRDKEVKDAGARVRKDVENLDEAEQAMLIKAFQGLMDLDPKNKDEYEKNPDKVSYFSLAAKHWFPAPTFCQHHISSYLPWHRYQMLDFENALRSIPGCKEVTLPYWNLATGVIPELLRKPPFASYTFPMDVYPTYYKKRPIGHDTRKEPITGRKGTTTKRNEGREEGNRGQKYEVNKVYGIETIRNHIATANQAYTFNKYNGIKSHKVSDKYYDTTAAIMRAHDWGHNGTGDTMSNQDVAAFDPIFWFFHSNWDRLWWEWQVTRKATTLDGFVKTLDKDDDQRWLLDEQMSISDPFDKHNYACIDLLKLGVAYDEPKQFNLMKNDILPLAMAPSWDNESELASMTKLVEVPKGNTLDVASLNVANFTSKNLNKHLLRVEGVNRINIPGSFYVVLYIDGVEVGRDAFFQSTFSGNCENCVSQAKLDFDFVFDQSLISNKDEEPKKIEVKIVNAIGNQIHLFEDIGNPTLSLNQLGD